MHVADDTQVSVFEDGGAFVLINCDHVPCFANARDMLSGPTDAEGKVEVWRNGAAGIW